MKNVSVGSLAMNECRFYLLKPTARSRDFGNKLRNQIEQTNLCLREIYARFEWHQRKLKLEFEIGGEIQEHWIIPTSSILELAMAGHLTPRKIWEISCLINMI